jgi:hypothetical protein
MLGLRRVVALGNGHCCVYSIAHQLEFAPADPMLAFNILQSDCLSLRQKAYNLLTTPSDFLSSCIAPFSGTLTSCCGKSDCKDWKRRQKFVAETECARPGQQPG